VVLRFQVVNMGPPLRDVYVGFYTQLVSGNKNAYGTWPPGSNSGPGTWYYKVHEDYDAARRLFREHYCQALPYPGSCNFAYCPPWVALKLLATHPQPVSARP